MKIIHVAKAAPVIKSEPVESLTILIDETTDDTRDLRQWEAFCKEQATLFVDAILIALPQGITDRILAELTKRKASLYIRSQRHFEKLLEEQES